MRRPITIIGSANVDMIMRLPKLPAPGETVTGGEFFQVFGGKGANQAVAAARAARKNPCAFIACVGRDLFANPMIDAFICDQLDVSRIVRHETAPTGTALIGIDAAGENAISVAPGANACLSPAYIDSHADFIRSSAMVILQMEIPVATTRQVLKLAAAANTPVMLNYAPVVSRDLVLHSSVHILVVNETEAQQLSGLPVGNAQQAETAARKLLGNGHKIVAITLGKAGAIVADASGARRIPAFQANAVDTTAAGDTFCGALAVGLVEGMPLDAAARFASAASAICVSRLGAQPSIPKREEIDALLNGT